jgi:hypothetical protein
VVLYGYPWPCPALGTWPTPYEDTTDGDQKLASSGLFRIASLETHEYLHFVSKRKLSKGDKEFNVDILRIDSSTRPRAQLHPRNPGVRSRFRG